MNELQYVNIAYLQLYILVYMYIYACIICRYSDLTTTHVQRLQLLQVTAHLAELQERK